MGWPAGRMDVTRRGPPPGLVMGKKTGGIRTRHGTGIPFTEACSEAHGVIFSYTRVFLLEVLSVIVREPGVPAICQLAAFSRIPR
jgi:hypothetical protein